MGVTNRELELKLELTGDELGRIEALAALRDLAIGEPASGQLRSLYSIRSIVGSMREGCPCESAG